MTKVYRTLRVAPSDKGVLSVVIDALPGAGGVQHLARLLGRGRAMEAILGAGDFDAEMAERYGLGSPLRHWPSPAFSSAASAAS